MTFEEEEASLWAKPCAFCRIAERDAPAQVVEEEPGHMVVVPHGPHVPGHVIVIPKRHLPNATVDPVAAAEVFAKAARYAAGLGKPVNIITSVGSRATQSVPHLHLHVIPRGDEDGLPERWPWIGAEHQREAGGAQDG